jgi:hypothetical protein
VSHARLRRAALLSCLLVAAFAGVASAGSLVEVDNLVLHADGGFTPRVLPRHGFAPIEFKGRIEIGAKDGGRPVPLDQLIVGFDRDGRLDSAGLPTCPPERIANVSTEEARQLCAGAIVGTGEIGALISLPEGPVPASSPLTIFNGPPQDGNPTVILHARTTVPGIQNFAIVVPIERRRGQFRYWATIDLPPIAAGLGAITHIDVKIGRRFRAGGARRSYVSARCSDSVLKTRGRLTFHDGTVIEGSVEKFCRAG